jgi:hypothetical protein
VAVVADPDAVAALTDRLDVLEGRVQQLERTPGRVAAPAPRDRGTASAGEERFWALNTLKDLAGEPGAVLFTGAVATPGGGHVEWQQAHPADDLLAADWSESSDRINALAHPVRLLLLHEVLNGRTTVAELRSHEQLGTTGQLYHHLRQLVAAGWLRASGHGRYQIPAERVVPLLITVAATRR